MIAPIGNENVVVFLILVPLSLLDDKPAFMAVPFLVSIAIEEPVGELNLTLRILLVLIRR